MGFLSQLFRKKNNSKTSSPASNIGAVLSDNLELQYYVNFENVIYGPFTLSELKTDYPILDETLITVDVLKGEWYEARCFECFDDLFDDMQAFSINEFGEIVMK